MIFLVFSQSFALESDTQDKDSTAYNKVGNEIQLGTSVENPNDYPVSASIEFVFENIEGDNYWDNKKHTGEADAKSSFVTHQKYFFQNAGRFYINMVYEIDGKQAKNTESTEFIIYEEDSKASLNGCEPAKKIVVRPDYSKAVCVFANSVEKLGQRGWIVDEQQISEEFAISLVKNQYPELQDFPSSGLPPKVIHSEKASDGWYVMFETQGSGRPLIEAKCYLVDNAKTVTLTGKYTPKTDDIQVSLSPKTCTPEITNCNQKENLPDMDCFIQSYQECTSAKIQQTRYTVEGDPISTTAIVEKTDATNECKIHVSYDSQDRFGFQGKYDSICSNVRLNEEFYWIIDQCENKDHAFEFYINPEEN
jgi:hypothetical protein